MFMLLFLPHVAFQAGSTLGSALIYSAAVRLMGVNFEKLAAVTLVLILCNFDLQEMTNSNFHFKQKQLLEAPKKKGEEVGTQAVY